MLNLFQKTMVRSTNLHSTKYFSVLVFSCALLQNCQTVSVSCPNIQGLVAHFPLDNSDLEKVNNNNTNTFGAVTTKNRFGSNNSAYDFDSGKLAYMKATATTQLTGETYSYSLWIQPKKLPSIGENVSVLAMGTQFVSIANQYSNNTGWTGFGYDLVEPATVSSVSSKKMPEINRWYHIVLTRDDQQMKMYVDGVLAGQNKVTNSKPKYGPDATLQISGRGPIQYFTGSVDDIRIFNRVVTDAEAAQLFNLTAQCEK